MDVIVISDSEEEDEVHNANGNSAAWDGDTVTPMNLSLGLSRVKTENRLGRLNKRARLDHKVSGLGATVSDDDEVEGL